MSPLLEWKVGRALAATNRPKVENVKTSNRLIDKQPSVFLDFYQLSDLNTYAFSWICITRARNAMGPLGDNLIWELPVMMDASGTAPT